MVNPVSFAPLLVVGLLAGLIPIGCASSSNRIPLAFVVEPVGADLAEPDKAPLILEALGRVARADGRFEVVPADSPSGEARAVGRVELLPAAPGTLQLRVQLNDAAGAPLASFSTGLSLDQPSLWPWTLWQRWKAPEPPTEAALVERLSQPRGDGESELRLRFEVLGQLRSGASSSDVALNPEVGQAFRARFGVDAGVALERPFLVPVPGGTAFLGNEQGEVDETPSHAVTVAPFWMAETEVTQQQYQAVVGNNPSLFTQTPDAPRRPVERVTWFDAIEFCNLLSQQEGLTPVYTLTGRSPAKGNPIRAAEVTQDLSRNGYRLPTEAEWEWAARGALPVATTLAGGEDPALVGWTDGAAEGPSPVAERDPNRLGLYDLSGNVWEWCWDRYGRYGVGPMDNPTGPEIGLQRVGRGGSWHAAAWMARVTARSFDNPGSRSNNLGFRVVRSYSASNR